MRAAVGGSLSALVLALSSATAAAPVWAAEDGEPSCGGARTAATDVSLARTERALHCLVNQVRADHRLRPVSSAGSLRRAALSHTQDMLRSGRFAHRVPGGPALGQRVARAGYLRGARRWSLGETLAYGSLRHSRPAALVQALLDSPPHRQILLDGRFTHVGIGVRRGIPSDRGADGVTVTLDFGSVRR